MDHPPIPERFPPLVWRKPAFLWTPVSLALAIGWPVGAFYNEPALQRLALAFGGLMFALALLTLGAAYALRQAPRARRNVVQHVLFAGALTALAAPFLLTRLLAAVADAARDGADANFAPAMAWALTPLTLGAGLLLALVSGLLFALVALRRRRPGDDEALDDTAFSHGGSTFS